MIAMTPTPEQIRQAAYFRWLRRGGGHGRDADDWSAAEQDLLFALNYRVIAAYRLDEEAPRILGRDRPRARCRFCEGAASPESALAIPEVLGNRSLRTVEVCGDCRGALSDALGEASRFVSEARSGDAPALSLAAIKGLTAMALAIAPEAELETLTDALEWAVNPDQDRDRRAFSGLGCTVHRGDFGGGPWAALARRVEDDAPFPHLLFFLGGPDAVVEAAVPLNGRDEDLEGREVTVPRVASTAVPTPEPSAVLRCALPAGPR